MQQKYIDILIKLAIKASKKDEVPISAIIVKNNKILVNKIKRKLEAESERLIAKFDVEQDINL